MTAVRVDPRVVETRRLVLAATYELISEVGFAGATVERIAERSGVARSSIYRHWPQPLPALHLEALAPLTERPEDAPVVGDVRVDVRAYLAHVVERVNTPSYATVTLSLLAVANADPAYADAHRALLAERTRVLRSLLRDAVRRGELCSCTDLAFETRMLLAPITHVRFVEHRRVERALAGRLVERLVAACAPHSGNHHHGRTS
ncbi:TetR/AcrR family transcriptional regulator [Jatrophihabitans fulvus]